MILNFRLTVADNKISLFVFNHLKKLLISACMVSCIWQFYHSMSNNNRQQIMKFVLTITCKMKVYSPGFLAKALKAKNPYSSK